ncbi:hypothetical protein CR513_01004, partial [Mucuna pruriens]
MCVNYWGLNEITMWSHFPILNVEDLLDELGGAKVFSKLDIRARYHQIRMRRGCDGSTKENHYYVKRSKCCFFMKKLECLRHFIFAKGVVTDLAKKQFVVEANASNGGMKVVLMQHQHSIAFVNKRPTKLETLVGTMLVYTGTIQMSDSIDGFSMRLNLRRYVEDVALMQLKEQVESQTIVDPMYNINGGILLRINKIMILKVPKLRDLILQWLHSSYQGGHLGIKATHHRIKQLFYWKGLLWDIEHYI